MATAYRSWVHTDEYNTWAGVCDLFMVLLSGGTGLFMYKKTGSMYEDGTDYLPNLRYDEMGFSR